MNYVMSNDGTRIFYEKKGAGPAVILVAAAASDHNDTKRLGELLSEHFTVYNYDRRGRGSSTDTAPYAVEREIEDIDSLIQEAGGSAYVFGSSSGAVLALDAASRLGDTKVSKLFLYEPPFIIDDSRAPVPAEYVQHLNALMAEHRRSDAVEYFMTAALGIPAEYIEFMKADPSWQVMEGMAHTLAYDGMIMGSTQSGQPLPTARWDVDVPVMVMTGENSGPMFHGAASALVDLLPQCEHRMLSGQDHSAVVMAPEVLAPEVSGFLQPSADQIPR
ncbi:alpha/beta fold hydrolase [Paenibacillus lautus]|uniref:alpha/beta fold hydrolase n=1 Tax=Paenibacillus lautus TaxID=1401 RepID=UPI001C10EA49|nr:alpha/beta hydrolase [Paenibacillus lautus]MBU5347760.1 alpha/beta hydrolase [Paenibacillus lautus]